MTEEHHNTLGNKSPGLTTCSISGSPSVQSIILTASEAFANGHYVGVINDDI